MLSNTIRCSVIAATLSFDRASLEQNPSFVVDRLEQLHQFGVGVIANIQFANVDGIAKAIGRHLEIRLKPFALEILIIAVPANIYIRMSRNGKDITK